MEVRRCALCGLVRRLAGSPNSNLEVVEDKDAVGKHHDGGDWRCAPFRPCSLAKAIFRFSVVRMAGFLLTFDKCWQFASSKIPAYPGRFPICRARELLEVYSFCLWSLWLGSFSLD